MDLLVLQGFSSSLEKQALSLSLLRRYAAGRAAKSVGGAAALGRKLTKAAPGATSRTIARAGGETGNLLKATRRGGQASQKARTLATRSGAGAERAGLQARGRKLDKAIRTAPETVTTPMKGAILSRGISPRGAAMMAGKTLPAAPGANKALAQMRSAAMPAQTGKTLAGVAPSSVKRSVTTGPSGRAASDAGTAVRKVRQRVSPTPAVAPAAPAVAPTLSLGTAPTQIAQRPSMPQTGRTLSGPAAVYQNTMLAQRPVRMGGRLLQRA